MENTEAKIDAATQEPQVPMPSTEQPSQIDVPNPELNKSDDLGELPDGVSERTRQQFEKLKTQLAEERAKTQSLFDTVKPSQPQRTVNNFYDPNTGLIDVTEIENLRQMALENQTELYRLKTERLKEEEDRQTKEVIATYPELDPKSKEYDKEFYKATRAVILDSMVNPKDYDGKPLTYKQAADIAKSINSKIASEAEKAGATKALEQLTPKEQAALEATGRSDRRVSAVDFSELQDRSRRNDYGAIMARLKGIPPVGKN